MCSILFCKIHFIEYSNELLVSKVESDINWFDDGDRLERGQRVHKEQELQIILTQQILNLGQKC
jgi:hypothetical protein